MRLSRLFTLAILLVLLGGARASAGQLIQDPSFDLGPSNPYWQCSHTWMGSTKFTCTSGADNVIENGQGHLMAEWMTEVPLAYRNHVHRLYQNFYIPPNVTSATLGFWLSSSAWEAPGLPNPDKMYVELYDLSTGSKLATFAIYDSWATQPFQWAYVSFPGLQAWKGKNVQLMFRAVANTNEDPSWWFVDDVTVNTTP